MQAEVFSRCGIPSNDIMLIAIPFLVSVFCKARTKQRTAPKKVLEDSGRDAVPSPSV